MDIRITKLRVALVALFVLAGVGLASLLSPLVGSALANVGQTVNISDHSASAYFAKVDSAGKLAVGDGAGPLSVDGTVSGRTAAPASPWHATENIHLAITLIAGPSASPINVTSLSISTDAPTGDNVISDLLGAHVSSSATSCTGAIVDGAIWYLRDAGDGVTPVAFSFPTPLQWKPPANTKACLFAYGPSAYSTTINAVGFYGG
jgi:hypothetical protein